MIRALVVDDSVVVRKIVTRAFQDDPLIEVVGVAASGEEALRKLGPLCPDAVILDLEMPGMGGLETLGAIRRVQRRLPVIIFSHLTTRGAAATIEALAHGATDFALKPTANGADLADDYVRAQLRPLLAALAAPREEPVGRTVSPAKLRPRPSMSAAVEVIVVAASTGGPAALATVIGSLPADLPVPVLVVQHMPATFTRMLAERLDRHATLAVTEAVDGDPVAAGRVYIAPGGRHMSVRRIADVVTILVHDGQRENSCRPSADVLFRGAAEIYGAAVVATILTGIGRDGVRGAAAVRAAGGWVIAQSADTSVAPGMPGAVIAAGLSDMVLPLDSIAGSLIRRLAVSSRP